MNEKLTTILGMIKGGLSVLTTEGVNPPFYARVYPLNEEISNVDSFLYRAEVDEICNECRFIQRDESLGSTMYSYFPYRIVRIPKGKGRFRTIYIPDEELKNYCNSKLQQIVGIARKCDIHNVQHGFTPGRSPVTNALCHVGWEYTMCFDLEDFFDTVTIEKLSSWCNNNSYDFDSKIVNMLMPDGAARQGLPTSPAIANMVASGMDYEIVSTLQWKGRMLNLVYTRYADDMTFSFNNPDLIKTLGSKVPEIAEKWGFKINARKTHTQWAGAGYRMITGVAVGPTGIHCPRNIKRRLRAARHQLQTEVGCHGKTLTRIIRMQKEAEKKGREVSINALLVGCYKGLKEWSMMTPPKEWMKNRKIKSESAESAKKIAATVINQTYKVGRKI